MWTAPLTYEAPRINFVPPARASTTSEMIEYEARLAGVTPTLAVKVAVCESGLDPKAKNPGSSASGLFQLTTGFRQTHCPEIDPFDPVENTKCALPVMAERLNHWEESFECWKYF